jgi:hypothetical protein
MALALFAVYSNESGTYLSSQIVRLLKDQGQTISQEKM